MRGGSGMKNSKQRILLISIVMLVIASMIMLAACSLFTVKVQAEDLMEGISANTVSGKSTDEKFINSTANFSINLFKKTVTKDKSSLISPTSVLLALSMTANGADKDTLSQMEEVLGIPIEELNEYLYAYVKSLPNEEKAKLSIANSIWIKEGFQAEQTFLQKNADYYNAAAYKSAFDDQAIKDINNWVNQNTDGTIEKIIEEINPSTVMFLINAMVFDAEWKETYEENNVYNDTFTSIDGSKTTVEFMKSIEGKYINSNNATGFIKPYASGYSFVALLPDEDVSIDALINSLSGESFLQSVQNAENKSVMAYLPKFSYEYTIQMNDALMQLGMPDAFDGNKADFSKISKTNNGLFIGEVLHKTFIKVDEKGTKAGAVTKVDLKENTIDSEIVVKLDRPFMYAIIDNTTNLPIFIGTVMDIEG